MVKKKNFKNLIFSKVLNFFRHGIGCFGAGLGMLFHLYKGLLVTHKFLEKNEKKVQKLLFFACGAPFTEDGLENSNFRAIFFDFLEEFVCDEQSFIEVK